MSLGGGDEAVTATNIPSSDRCYRDWNGVYSFFPSKLQTKEFRVNDYFCCFHESGMRCS